MNFSPGLFYEVYNLFFYIRIYDVYLFLNIHCLFQGSNNPAILLYIFKRHGFPFPVFQPFIADLIAADLIFPNLLRNALKITLLVYIDLILFMPYLFYFVVS